jgi:type I restriction enzyme M protein
MLRASDIKKIADAAFIRASIDKFSRLVSQDEIRRNDYNLNIPRYVDSSEPAETWDIYASMFGGLPKTELAAFDEYWNTFTGLKSVLFEDSGTPHCALATSDIEKAIKEHEAVIGFKCNYREAFGDFADMLKGELIGKWETLNINKEESFIADEIFERLERVALVDKYSAYQALDDEWTKTAIDLEILQTEGFGATRKVNPNMVLKKKDGKDQEVQEGWAGHIIPFELVQASILKEEAEALQKKEKRLSDILASYDEIIDSLPEDEKESVILNDAKDSFSTAEVSKKIKELFGSLAKAKTAIAGYSEDSFERKLVQVQELIDEEKRLKREVKEDSAALHLLTKKTIEGLAEAQVVEMLEVKWIEPLMKALNNIPDNIISNLVSRVRALVDKYSVTYTEVAEQISEAKISLSALIDELTGNEYDMKGLGEFQSLLNGEHNG